MITEPPALVLVVEGDKEAELFQWAGQDYRFAES